VILTTRLLVTYSGNPRFGDSCGCCLKPFSCDESFSSTVTNGFSIRAVAIVELTETLYVCLSQYLCLHSSSCDLLSFEAEPGFGTGRGYASPESSSLVMKHPVYR